MGTRPAKGNTRRCMDEAWVKLDYVRKTKTTDIKKEDSKQKVAKILKENHEA